MSNEIVVNQVTFTNKNTQAFKAPYLLVVQIKKGFRNFLSLEKPEFFHQHLSTKGFFCEASDDEIAKNFAQILTDTSRELYTEMSFPLTKVEYVKNLVYKAK
jgi:hypothetical protein